MEPVSHRHFRGRKPGLGRSLRHSAIFVCLFVQLGLSLLLPMAAQAADESLEYRVKAAFLLNFIKFIEWPPTAFQDSSSPITICLLGDDPFGRILDQIVEGEVVTGRKITVARIKIAPAPKACQVVFASKTGKEVLNILRSLEAGVLTVGEGESFIREGGMIAFVIEERHVRFRANQAAAENAGLKLSSKLLSVAKSGKE
jgi:hypothetical protein